MRRINVLVLGLVALSLVFAPGCGLLINGQKQSITIDTNPTGADVNILGAGMQGITPMSVRLKRNRDYQIIAKKGEKTGRAYVNSEIEPLSVILDVVFWLAIPLLIDWPMGANHQLSPQNVYIGLTEPSK